MAATSYLQKLSFSSVLENTFIAGYLKNVRLVVLLILVIVIVGAISFASIPRVLNPAINIAIVTIQTTLPGAGPDSVESLVSVPIEQAVSNVSNIDTITSTSQNSLSLVTIQFLSGVDADKATSDVQTAVQTVNTLPKDASTPHVQKVDFENAPIWTFTVTARDPISLLRFSRLLRDSLKDTPTLNTISTTGIDNQEIQVLIKPPSLTLYGINPQSLSQSITAAINSAPAGNITTNTSSFSLTIDPTITRVEDLRNLRIPLAGGSTIPLEDIADIAIRPQPGMSTSFAAKPREKLTDAVTFSVFKKHTANVTSADAEAHTIVNALTQKYKNTVSVTSDLDSGDMINRQFNELVRDLLITFTLVFLVIFIFLGTRQAIIAAMAIPLTFLITFIVMHTTNIDLSFIAFFSLLLSLGLLVDDTIVVISALSAYHKTGKFTPFQTGLLVWRDFKTAIFTTTLTTVWAFIPLLLSTGIIGEFIKPIPIVVSSALISSFGVAMFVTLPLVIIIFKPTLPHRVVILLRLLLIIVFCFIFLTIAPKGVFFLPSVILLAIAAFIFWQTKTRLFGAFKLLHKENSQIKRIRLALDQGLIGFERISKKYEGVLRAILESKVNRRKTLAMVIIFSLFSYFLLPLGFVRNEFFPASAQDFFTISLELPSGTNTQTTKAEALKIASDAARLPEVQFVTMDLGTSGNTGGFSQSNGGSNLAAITVVLPPTSQQRISSIDLAQRERDKYATYQKGKISIIEESGGPPAGADVQIKLFGTDLSILDNFANKVESFLKSQAGITNIDKSIKSGTSKIVFIPDYQKMSDEGITRDQAALWLRTFASGFTLDSNVQIESGNTKSQDIILRMTDTEQKANTLEELSVQTPGGPVPLSALGTLTIKPNPTLITRENGKRTISVTASVTKGYSVSQKNADLENFANSLNLPPGYSWSTGGVNQQNQDSLNSIFQAMILSFLLIIITMVLQFSSFRKAFIVMLVIPLSISGVFIVFSITHTPLSFPALIGILALFGIVVKNSILIVDKINQNIKAGLSFENAIIDASESRLEPIALTSFTAIVGLIPITLSNALWQGLGGAIIAGLLFSGSIMLFFVPVVYYYMFKSSEGKVL